ncbi:MAG: hypothetical protein ACTS73_07475 [Arsenophonus sp. NEOnobi-MAG3]
MVYRVMSRQDDRLCLLVIIGITEHGRKQELVALEDAYRKSEQKFA